MLTLSAWVLGVAGVGLAYFIALAGAMKTAPSRSPKETLVSGILPVLTILLGSAALMRALPTQSPVRAILLNGVPILLGLLGAVIAFVPLTGGPGHSSLWEPELGARSDGTKYFRDSDANWRHDEPLYRATVSREAAGEPPPPPARSWPGYWDEYFEGLRKWHENPDRHIGFITTLRRERGLPEPPDSSGGGNPGPDGP